MSRSRRRQVGVLLVWSAVAMAAIGALHAAGRGALAPPPLGSPSAWGAWLDGRDPVVAAFALARVLALAAAWYVAVVTVIGSTAHVVSSRRLVAAVDRVTLPVLRRLVLATMSVSLGTGLPPALAAKGPPPATATTTTVAVAGGNQGPPSTITMRRLPPVTDGIAPAVPAVEHPSAPGPATEAPAPTGRTWTVTSGQCFWSIAEAVLTEDLGRKPAPRAVVPYWERLIEANRSALADPANPDLVFPGQVFTVPAP